MPAYSKIALALVASAAVSSALAQAIAPTSAAPSSAQASPAVQVAVPAGGGGLVVFKDPATGGLRQPDADEIRALLPPARQPGPVTQRPMAAGGFAVMLDSSFDSFMITKREPDGSLAFDCLTPQEIVATAKARTVPRALPTFKELPDVQ